MPDRTNKIGRAIAVLVLASDLFIGLAWTLSDLSRTNSTANKSIRDALSFLPGAPVRWWGGLLILLSVVALCAICYNGWRNRRETELIARYALSFLFAYWAMWTFAYGWNAAVTPTAAITPVGLAFTQAIGHLRPILAPQKLVRPPDA